MCHFSSFQLLAAEAPIVGEVATVGGSCHNRMLQVQGHWISKLDQEKDSRISRNLAPPFLIEGDEWYE
jgi:hypothetical protein